MAVRLISSSFHASILSSSPSKHRLIVQGVIEAPTPGYTIKLVTANPQGINRHILLLSLDVKKPTGIVPQHVVHQNVSFEQDLGSEVVSQVTIENPGQEAITLNVPAASTGSVNAEPDTFSAVYFPSTKHVKGRLVVDGKVRAPTPGWLPRLTVANPQGINPRILLLVLEATPPRGPVPQHVVDVDVSFVQRADAPFYSSVSILNSQGEGVPNLQIEGGFEPGTVSS
jgi:hypothetical protein